MNNIKILHVGYKDVVMSEEIIFQNDMLRS